jgi:hypothetical protein
MADLYNLDEIDQPQEQQQERDLEKTDRMCDDRKVGLTASLTGGSGKAQARPYLR